MSTLSFGLVLGALALLGTRSAPGALQPATARGPLRPSPQAAPRRHPAVRPMLARRLPPAGDTELAVERGWSILGRVGVGWQPPRRVVTGRRARIRWWHRLFSLVLLFGIVVVVGLAIASAIGILIVAAGFLVEQAIG